MSASRQPKNDSSLEELLGRLSQSPSGGSKMLDLALALANKGHGEAAAQAELAALELGDPDVTHRWRLIQARRAPSNQFLLLQNELRTAAFRKALEERISPGDLVLELGTGSGILAMLAARKGAVQVVSCEKQPLMARTAEAIIRDNGLSEQITVVAKDANELELGTDLPRRANILISDMFTSSLLDAGGLKLIESARTRLTRDDGLVIPAAATLRGRLVGGQDLERLCRCNIIDELDLSRFNLFSPPVIHIPAERFLTLDYRTHSDTLDCFHFDFNTLAGFEPRHIELAIECNRTGDVTGFLQWLRLELSPGSILESNESSSLNWTRFLHVFPEPIPAKRGQLIYLNIAHDWKSMSIWPSR